MAMPAPTFELSGQRNVLSDESEGGFPDEDS